MQLLLWLLFRCTCKTLSQLIETLSLFLKMFNSETGRLLYSTLEDSRPLLCVCSLPRDDRYVFAGTDNGILHSIWLHDPKVILNTEICCISFLFTNPNSLIHIIRVRIVLWVLMCFYSVGFRILLMRSPSEGVLWALSKALIEIYLA